MHISYVQREQMIMCTFSFKSLGILGFSIDMRIHNNEKKLRAVNMCMRTYIFRVPIYTPMCVA